MIRPVALPWPSGIRLSRSGNANVCWRLRLWLRLTGRRRRRRSTLGKRQARQ